MTHQETIDLINDKMIEAITGERERCRQIVIRHTTGHFWVGEAILCDIDSGATPPSALRGESK